MLYGLRATTLLYCLREYKSVLVGLCAAKPARVDRERSPPLRPVKPRVPALLRAPQDCESAMCAYLHVAEPTDGHRGITGVNQKRAVEQYISDA